MELNRVDIEVRELVREDPKRHEQIASDMDGADCRVMAQALGITVQQDRTGLTCQYLCAMVEHEPPKLRAVDYCTFGPPKDQ